MSGPPCVSRKGPTCADGPMLVEQSAMRKENSWPELVWSIPDVMDNFGVRS